jgi:hypothetical protein
MPLAYASVRVVEALRGGGEIGVGKKGGRDGGGVVDARQLGLVVRHLEPAVAVLALRGGRGAPRYKRFVFLKTS